MADWDLFNGDADGIFSLVQLRREEPRNATLVTGVKRDIALFERIRVQAGDRVTALDISMARNTDGLRAVLGAGASVFYCDHHRAGEVPDHPGLTALLDAAPESCTAALIDGHLQGTQRAWAVCGAYGDNFQGLAARLGEGLSLPMDALRELGELVNYNAYGMSEADLRIHPAELYERIVVHDGPVAFLESERQLVRALREGRAADWAAADRAELLHDSPALSARRLPASPASNRIGGPLGNRVSERDPARGHVILTDLGNGTDRVSLRAPRRAVRETAGEIATRFGGGGRAAAAGIDALDRSALPDLLRALESAFSPD